jgi:hypothetical protein
MLWLLIVIHLNLSVTPIQIQHGEILETFPSEQKCLERQAKFFDDAKQENRPIPPFFNLGCVPLKRSIV